MAQQMNIRNQQIGKGVKGAAIVFLCVWGGGGGAGGGISELPV